MKRTISVLGCILFVMLVLLPYGKIMSFCFGYTLELVRVNAFSIVTAVLSICLVILSVKGKEVCSCGIIKVIFALLTPLSLISTVFYVFESSSIVVIVCMFICIGCSLFLTAKYGNPLALKITTFSLSAIMIFMIGYFGFIALIFGNMAENTVVQAVESPDGKYYAELIDNDQGALGGSTLVSVYETKVIDAIVFRLSEKPKSIYQGEWGEYESMDIYWKDDNCLIINSVEYEIE